MSEKVLPRYPIYVPSKSRFDTCLTAQFLERDGVPFFLVVEPSEHDRYAERFGADRLLVLPRDNFTLMGARNWIKDHSAARGDVRHWQLDDNIRVIRRLYRGTKIPCEAGVALRVTEDFVDRYENVAIAGLNYTMFAYMKKRSKLPPYYQNIRVYSCSLVLNAIPHRWRLVYNDDTDICLQVLADGWCTILMNIFLIEKIRTMTLSGGNTDSLYRINDGRLKMARSLQRMWPGVVETRRRFQRPQHVVKKFWRGFTTPLKKKPGLSIDPGVNEYGMEIEQVSEKVKGETVTAIIEEMRSRA